MGTKIFIISLLFLISVTTIFSTCKKGGLGCASVSYSFEGNATAFPDVDTFNTGDTIFIESNIPTQQTDFFSGKIIDYSNATNLSLSIQFLELIGGSISNPGTIYVADNF